MIPAAECRVLTATPPMNPLLISSTDFMNRLLVRGYPIDLNLRGDLLLMEYAFHVQETDMPVPEYWQAQDLTILDVPHEKIRYLRSLLVMLSTFPKVNSINYCVILFHFTPLEIKNLYRFLYIEWRRVESFSKLGETIRFDRLPSEVYCLGSQDLHVFWLNFLESIYLVDIPVFIYFFLNRLYQYLLPFTPKNSDVRALGHQARGDAHCL